MKKTAQLKSVRKHLFSMSAIEFSDPSQRVSKKNCTNEPTMKLFV